MKKISFKKKAQDHTFIWRFLHRLFKNMKGQHPDDYKANLYLLKKHEDQNLPPDDKYLQRFTAQLGGKELSMYRAFYKSTYSLFSRVGDMPQRRKLSL